MKIIASLIFIICLQLCTHCYGQSVTLSLKNASLQTVFEAIQKQTDYNFFFKDEWLLNAKRVDINVQKAPVLKVLQICFKSQPLTYVITGKTITLKPIQDLENMPNNNDSLLANASDKIMKGRNEVLEPVTIVSTGYQEIPKERATGSFVKINNELFNRTISSDILSRLDGITSGVLFDKRKDNPNIQIRGLFTLTESIAQPLIVVNNFPYEGNINNLNPNDVESVTILKDAAATSIWGAKAGNGVIVITTKKGSFNQKPQVSFNNNILITKKPDLFKIPDLSSSDYIDLEKYLFDQEKYLDDINDPTGTTPLTPAVEIFLKQQNGEISDIEANQQLDVLRKIDVRNDFEKYIYRNAINKQWAANVNGGTKKLKYYFSAGYDRGLDNLVGNESHRITLNSDNTFLPVRNLEVRVGVRYTQTLERNNSEGDYSQYFIGSKKLPLYSQLVDAQGHPLSINTNYRGSFTDTAGAGKLLDWKYRPLEEIANNDNTLNTRALLAEINVKYNFTKTLDGEIKYQYQEATDNYIFDYNIKTFFARNLINKFTLINGDDITYIIPKGDIVDHQTNHLYYNALRGQLNFNKKWGERHKVYALAGAELRQTNTSLNGYRQYAGNVDEANDTIPLYDINPNRGTSRFVSLYGNASYTYLERYIFSASVRKDASNLFGVKANRKGVPLWSTGALWKISKEKFYHSSFLPYLNLRLTYGFSGNVNNSIPAVTTISRKPASFLTYTNLPSSTISNVPNSQLRWEKVRQFNIGLDMASKNSRITGSVEYYLKKSTDVLGARLLDPTVGVTFLITNSANISGRGTDVQLNTVNVDGSSFKWNTSLLFSHVVYKVSKYSYPNIASDYVNDALGIKPIEGYSPYLIASYKWAGLNPLNGDPLGYLNGQVSDDYNAIVMTTSLSELHISGSALPTYFGNLLNSFFWKGFSLSANVTYKFGYFFRRPTINYTSLIENLSGHPDYLKRWQQPGDEQHTTVPSLLYPNSNSNRDVFYAFSELMVEKADHIRLNDIRLNYDIGKVNFNKVSFRKIQLYASVSNLNILLWKANKSGIDPDYPSGSVPGYSMAIGFKADF